MQAKFALPFALGKLAMLPLLRVNGFLVGLRLRRERLFDFPGRLREKRFCRMSAAGLRPKLRVQRIRFLLPIFRVAESLERFFASDQTPADGAFARVHRILPPKPVVSKSGFSMLSSNR